MSYYSGGSGGDSFVDVVVVVVISTAAAVTDAVNDVDDNDDDCAIVSLGVVVFGVWMDGVGGGNGFDDELVIPIPLPSRKYSKIVSKVLSIIFNTFRSTGFSFGSSVVIAAAVVAEQLSTADAQSFLSLPSSVDSADVSGAALLQHPTLSLSLFSSASQLLVTTTTAEPLSLIAGSSLSD